MANNKEMNEINILKKLSMARVAIQDKEIKKSGKNEYANFDYLELKDFLPHVNEVFNELGLIGLFRCIGEKAQLVIVNTDNPTEKIEFETDTAEATVKGCTPVQNLGSMHTYLRRYLYKEALELAEKDSLDSEVGSDKLEAKPNTIIRYATKKQVDYIKEILPPDEIKQIQIEYAIANISELTIQQASDIISKIKNGVGIN